MSNTPAFPEAARQRGYPGPLPVNGRAKMRAVKIPARVRCRFCLLTFQSRPHLAGTAGGETAVTFAAGTAGLKQSVYCSTLPRFESIGNPGAGA